VSYRFAIVLVVNSILLIALFVALICEICGYRANHKALYLFTLFLIAFRVEIPSIAMYMCDYVESVMQNVAIILL